MKKFLSILPLAALTIGLLCSCSKLEERISNLEKRVDGIESTSIASVQQQIDAIKTSINDLKAADVAINGKIDDLKTTAETQQTLIDALKEADIALGQKDEELEGRIATLEGQVATIGGQIETLVNADKAINTRIDELKSYVDTQIGKTKDWATETFATLTQYQKTADNLAALSVTVEGISTTLTGVQTSISGLETTIHDINDDLQGKITAAKTELEGKITSLKTELEGKIASAISASETTIQGWVNEQLSAYYTAAQVNAKIADLQTQINTLKTDTDANKTKIAELEAKLTSLAKDLEAAKDDIEAAYKKAIKDAIESNGGYITEAIKNAINNANGKIEALTGRVETLESDVATLKNDVAALKAMIQTVTIIPAYTDGSVEAEDGTLTVDFVVSPVEAVKGVEADCIKVLVHKAKVQTKAASYETIGVKTVYYEKNDAGEYTGNVTITADISGIPPAEGKGLTVAINVKNGISDYTTEFVPVTVSEKPIETIADVLATVDGGFPQGAGKMKEPPSNAWVYGSDRYSFVIQNSALIFYYSEYVEPISGEKIGNSTYILLSTKVEQGKNCYTATVINKKDDALLATLKFQMEAGKLTSIIFSGVTESMKIYDGTYDTFHVDLKMARAGESESDWNKIAILIKGTDVVSGKYYFNVSSDEKFANGVELNDEQIESINKAEGLRIVKENLEEETTYQTVLVVSNSAGYSKTIVTTREIGQIPPP